jgi:hypothetical protein
MMERNFAPSKMEVNHIVIRKKTANSTHGTRMQVCGMRLRGGSMVGTSDGAKCGWFVSW